MTAPRGPWRLLVTEALDGPTNMAVDEALLRSRLAGLGPPTVRFYGWNPPTVSLGYGQPLDDRIDQALCRRWGIGLVRRPTGGSAVLHEPPDREVTYSVVARRDDFPGADDLLETYRVLASGLQAGFARLGLATDVVPLVRARAGTDPAFCFARTGAYELAVGGRKLCGSAQRRQAGAFLQHGSVLLDADPARVRAVFPDADVEAIATVTAGLGRRLDFWTVTDALAAGLAATLAVELRRGGLDPDEWAAAERLVADKYGTARWLHEGSGAAAPAVS